MSTASGGASTGSIISRISRERGTTIATVGSDKVACVNTDKAALVAENAAVAKAKLTGLKFRVVGTTLLRGGNDYIGEALRKAGANVTVSSLDNANWASVTAAGGKDWDINVQGDNNQLGTLTSSLLRVMGPATEDGGRNKMGVVNDVGYGYVQKAMSEVDRSAQCAALQGAQKSFLQRVDAIPLAVLPTTTITASGVGIRQFDDYIDPATVRIDG